MRWKVMIDIYMKNEIITLYRRGMKIKQIQRELNISRNTVRTYVREYGDIQKQIEQTSNQQEIIKLQEKMVSAPVRKGVSVRKVFTGDLKQRFYELLRKDEEKDLVLGLNKQKLTASLLHRKLISEGFDVGITTIQLEFKKYKNKQKEAYIKQEYSPGQRAEYDFHEIKVIINGKVKKLYQATITLPFSNYIFVKHYQNQKFEAFIDSLVNFFEEVDGIPKQIVFDNMRNVVSRFVYGGTKDYNKELIKLSNYYGFKIMTTNPRRGNEKGHVENSGKIARTELFTFNYEFDSIEDLRNYAKEEMLKVNDDKTQIVDEKFHLISLPKTKYELGRLSTSKVNHESLIMIDSNYYSVPDRYVGMSVYCNVYLDYINIYNEKHELIASHNKKVGKGKYMIDIFHFTTTFMRKPGALLNSLALKQAPKVIQTLFHKYFTTNPKDFIKLINKNDIYELNELLVKLNNGYKLTGINDKEITIEDVSLKQLNQISNLFNQGEKVQ
jgi:transposase